MSKELMIQTVNAGPLTKEAIAAMMPMGDNGMVKINSITNATGKLTKDWVQNKRTQELLAQFKAQNSDGEIPLSVKKGGKTQGTWIHHKLCNSYLMWLFPAYELLVGEIMEQVLNGTMKVVENEPVKELSLEQQLIISQGHTITLLTQINEAEKVNKKKAKHMHDQGTKAQLGKARKENRRLKHENMCLKCGDYVEVTEAGMNRVNIDDINIDELIKSL